MARFVFLAAFAFVVAAEVEIFEGTLRGAASVADVGCQGHANRNWHHDFNNAMLICGRKTGGANPAAGQCMAELQHITPACGTCLGSLIACNRDHCVSACCFGSCPDKAECKSCNADFCHKGFSDCAGENL